MFGRESGSTELLSRHVAGGVWYTCTDTVVKMYIDSYPNGKTGRFIIRH